MRVGNIESTAVQVTVTAPRLASKLNMDGPVVVEYREVSRSGWRRVEPSDREDTEYDITGLKPRARYEIRAVAKFERKYETQRTFHTRATDIQRYTEGDMYRLTGVN